MSGIQTYIPSALEVTDSAIAKVQSLKSEEENENLKLRVYVTGGGCSGFQYGFSVVGFFRMFWILLWVSAGFSFSVRFSSRVFQ